MSQALMQKGFDIPTINECLRQLQSSFNLEPIAKANTFGKDIHALLNAPEGENPVHPFQQTRIANEFRTCLSVSKTASNVACNDFRFVEVRESGGKWAPRGSLDSDMADVEIIEALQRGFGNSNDTFGCNWDAFRASPHFPHTRNFEVDLSELGLFLGQYREVVGLSDKAILQQQEEWPGDVSKSQWMLTGTRDDKQKRLNDLFQGKIRERIPFERLRQLLHGFDEPTNPRDVPELMAEWLTAERKNAACIELKYRDFFSPPSVAHSGRATYQNAPERIDGFECSFVRLELPPNEAVVEVDGHSHEIDRVTELLRHFENPDADKVPHTHLHVHPGDELILILAGSAFLQLENTGIWTPLQQGDYVHFNAEIPHALWNLSRTDATVALIVRFFQLDRHGTRRRQIKSLKRIAELMSTLGREVPSRRSRIEVLVSLEKDIPAWIRESKESYVLWRQLASWVQDRTRVPQDRLNKKSVSDERSRIQDLVGLSRYLHSHLSQDFACFSIQSDSIRNLRMSIMQLRHTLETDLPNISDEAFHAIIEYDKCLNAVSKELSDQGEGSQVRACFEGMVEDVGNVPTIATVRKIAKELGLPPVLLDGYAAPPALRVVFVRGAMTGHSQQYRDWVQPPVGASGSAIGADYWIPSRTLANSDMSVTLLSLKPGGCSSWNHHPGIEAVVPLCGSVRVEFQNIQDANSEPCGTEGMLVYKSSESHRVSCTGCETAQVIVMRFGVPDRRN
ncbi:MAG: cupin domain-containing protein [Planctomycetaceae bacterium]|nr:cupin domain-containing protein [Planctomycetaceae bacterium]